MLLRSLRTPRPYAHRTYNRYTGGTERRSSLSHPPSRYARGYSTSAAAQPEEEEVSEDFKQSTEDLEDKKEAMISSLEEKLAEAKAAWQASLAETDNITKKMLKDIAQTRDTAADKLAQKLFPVSDTLEFCIRHRPDFDSDPAVQNNLEAKGAFDGLEAAKRQFVTAMRSINITEIVPQVSDQFDPMLHNACFEVESSATCQPGQVGVVIKTGWARNTTLFRAADVGVAKAREFVPPISSQGEDDDEGNIDSDDEKQGK